MTELDPEAENAPHPTAVAAEAPEHGSKPRATRVALMVGALGVVFGDIGTSPLYAMQSVFSIDNGAVRPSAGDVYGAVSLIFWSITLIVSVKYVVFVLRADNDGEGGVMALAALARRTLATASGRQLTIVMALGVLGASLFYGDSVITPAISVLSAVEGVEVAAPQLSELVVPIAAVILAVLFAVQRWGTQRVGRLFGPVMLLWFVAVGVVGVRGVLEDPAVLRGLSPTYAVAFVAERPGPAFIAMGAVVLAITGAEALYADMSHFGRSPIRHAWFFIVFPALVLNYLAQGGLVLRDPSARTNPFFMLLPSWAQIPMVVLATAATLIASQAVISGAFSVSRQALRLGFLPRLRIRHTSASVEGQVYVPSVNWTLFVAVLAVILTFKASSALATAYGVAVTGTFLITTALLLTVARQLWHWSVPRLLAIGLLFGVVEVTYFAANLTKVHQGGWLTLLIGAAVFTVMMTWQKGRGIVTARRLELEGPLQDFLDHVHADGVERVPGTAVFPHPSKETTPLALRANFQHNHVIHERVVLITGETEQVPHIPWEERLECDDLGDRTDGIMHIRARFGFQDPTDFPEVLRRAAALDDVELDEELDPDQASYFVSRVTVRRTKRPGMRTWRKALFIALAHNAASQAEFLHLPDERTVVMGSQVDL